MIATVVCLAGCRKTQPEIARSASPSSPSPEEQAQIDALRSLPYLANAPRKDREVDGVEILDEKRSAPGYNLYSVHQRCRAELIDSKGKLLRAWQLQPSSSWSNAELLPNGDLVVAGWDANEQAEAGIADDKRYVARFDWNGKLLWKRTMPAHHDVEQIASGNLMTLTFQRRVIPAVDETIPVRDDQISILDPQGNLVRSLSLFDTLSRTPGLFPIVKVSPNRTGESPWIDLFHCNSIEWMRRPELAAKSPLYAASNVLVCFRHQDRIAIVDMQSEKVVWAWGRGIVSAPHDAQVLDDGHILLFDNGIARGWSRALEMDPLTGEIVWEYKAPNPGDLYSASRGAAQRLPNGNTLITNSDHGVAIEVTRSGEVVWRYNYPGKNERGQRDSIVRTKRYSLEFVEKLLERPS